MNELSKFKITIDGNVYDAYTIMNFELYGDYYCIYGVKNSDNNYDIYAGQVVDGKLGPILKDKDKELVNKIVLALTNVIKEGE